MLIQVVSTILVSYAAVKLVKRRWPWLWPELKGIATGAGVMARYHSLAAKNVTMLDLWDEQVKRRGDNTMLIFQGESHTWNSIARMVDKVARAAIGLGLTKGDTVAILMRNQAPYIWIYLGLAKIGVRLAFLNFNLRSKSLLHCINVSGAKRLIVGPDDDLFEAVEEIKPDILKENPDFVFYHQGGSSRPEDYVPIDKFIDDAPDTPVDKSLRGDIKYSDEMLYIYTSGTTGLPKAAIISQGRCVKASLLMHAFNVNENDVIYTPLPLYHSAALLIGLGSCITSGATMVLRQKFSASHFIDDCRRHNVTIVQYIGELCRFLISRPPKADDSEHSIRLAFGNGLRRDVWEEFQNRFKIPTIGEFYAATEGNVGFMNLNNKMGSIGRLSPVFEKVYPAALVKYDHSIEAPARDFKGHCMRVQPGEPGLLIAPVKKDFEFDGYKGKKDLNAKKYVRNVFKDGDIYISSGDLLIKDEEHNLYFNDRIGDTFRWKGENVSTTEVANVVGDVGGIKDANVYGVEVPGCDGRAGMAALTLDTTDASEELLCAIYKHCQELLPIYARPLFLRIIPEMEMTSTFKQKKVEYVKEGFDLNKVQDPIYFSDPRERKFVRLHQNLFDDIANNTVRM